MRALPGGPGGLVAAVAPAAAHLGATWLYAAASDADHEVARSRREGVERGGMTLRLLSLPPEEHRRHYEVISSGLLAPLFHYVFSLTYAPAFTASIRDAWRSYRRVNELFGGAICALAPHDAILVEDAPLMLAGAAVRARADAPDAPLAYFHHVPWCEPAYFGILPAALRVEILASVLAYDSVGFHCRRWADAFAACCERFLPGVQRCGDRVEWRGRSTDLAVAPAAIDSLAVRAAAASPDAARWRERFLTLKEDRCLVVRVERADPSKNALRGLQAYELLLERRPELATGTRLLAVATPVRGWVEEYRHYLAATRALVDRINERFGAAGPVVSLELAHDARQPDHSRAVAALGVADVHVVNPTFDGLNLVAMEGAVAGDAALILSENAGVHELLGPAAISVNPFDVEQTAAAIERAISEPTADRRAAAALLRERVEARTPHDWMAERVARCQLALPA